MKSKQSDKAAVCLKQATDWVKPGMHAIMLLAMVAFSLQPIYSMGDAHMLKGKNRLDEITLYQDTPFVVDKNLTIRVLEIVEEWVEPNRRSVMFITLQMLTPEGNETKNITSDEPLMVWKNYKFQYVGGWRSEVRLKLIQSQ